MKKRYEAVGFMPYNAYLGGRYVHYRDIKTGMNLCQFYYGNNKRKMIDRIRKEEIIVYHSLYRDFEIEK